MTAAAKSIDRRRHGGAHPGAVSLSIRVIGPLLSYLAARGYVGAAFLRDHDIDPALLRDPEARLPHVVAIGLWQSAGEFTHDSNLGLHVAEGIRPGAFGALDYAVRTSETMGVGLQRLCRYHRVLHDVAEVKLTVDRGRAMLSHHLPVPGGPPRAVSEFIVAGWLALADEVIE
jgi:Arabinose-binding domain of AraC transcription regulator, N-term